MSRSFTTFCLQFWQQNQKWFRMSFIIHGCSWRFGAFLASAPRTSTNFFDLCYTSRLWKMCFHFSDSGKNQKSCHKYYHSFPYFTRRVAACHTHNIPNILMKVRLASVTTSDMWSPWLSKKINPLSVRRPSSLPLQRLASRQSPISTRMISPDWYSIKKHVAMQAEKPVSISSNDNVSQQRSYFPSPTFKDARY